MIFNQLELERSSLMTFSAIRKIVVAKRAPIIVTRSATLHTAAGEMHRSGWRRNLGAAPHPGSDGMTLCTADSFSCVFAVAKVDVEGSRRCRSSDKPSGLMACRTRTDILSADHRLRPVTLETRRVSTKPRRY